MTPPLSLQIDWTGNDEVGVIFFHKANETIPEQRRIQPKVRHRCCDHQYSC